MTWRILMVSVSSNAPLTCCCKSINHINYLLDSSFPSSNWEHPESNSISCFFKTQTLFLPQQHGGKEKEKKNLLSSWGKMSFFNASISSCNPLRVKPRYSSASSWRPCESRTRPSATITLPYKSLLASVHILLWNQPFSEETRVWRCPPTPSVRQDMQVSLNMKDKHSHPLGPL